MAPTFTTNLNLELQGTGDNSGTWGTVLNTAALAVVDQVLGGMQTLSLSNVNVSVSTSQSQNNFIKLTGVLSGNVIITFPAIGRTYWIKNSTTGSFTVTIARSGGATSVVIPQGYAGLYGITSDGVTDLSVLAVTSGTATALTITNSTFILKQAADPSPTAEGDMQWSTLYDQLKIGDGSTTKRFWSGPAPGLLYGCGLSNNVTDPTNDINFAAGVAVDSTNLWNMTLSALTKRLDAAWAVGTGQGGLFSGAVADGTYHCFVIMRTDTGVVDAGFDTSVTAANRPVAYTLYRRVGSIVRTGSAIKLFLQYNDVFTWMVAAGDYDATLPTTTTTITLTVPTGITVEARISAGMIIGNVSGGSRYSLFTSLEQTDTAASSDAFTVAGTMDGSIDAGSSGGYAQVRTNTSGQIRGRSSVANFTSLLSTHAFVDYRGQ